MGSADLMTRNLDHRIEIAVPVEDPRLQAQLAAAFDALLEDNTAWTLQPDGDWKRLKPRKDQPAKPSQQALMRKARTRARRRVTRRPR
jgi:polyphosphate kinase